MRYFPPLSSGTSHQLALSAASTSETWPTAYAGVTLRLWSITKIENKGENRAGWGLEKGGCRPKACSSLVVKLWMWNYIQELILQHGRFKSDDSFGRNNLFKEVSVDFCGTLRDTTGWWWCLLLCWRSVSTVISSHIRSLLSLSQSALTLH